jgi:hypothetical protein
MKFIVHRDARLFFHGYLREKTNFYLLSFAICRTKGTGEKRENEFSTEIIFGSNPISTTSNREIEGVAFYLHFWL